MLVPPAPGGNAPGCPRRDIRARLDLRRSLRLRSRLALGSVRSPHRCGLCSSSRVRSRECGLPNVGGRSARRPQVYGCQRLTAHSHRSLSLSVCQRSLLLCPLCGCVGPSHAGMVAMSGAAGPGCLVFLACSCWIPVPRPGMTYRSISKNRSLLFCLRSDDRRLAKE